MSEATFDSSVEARLQALGLELPPAPPPAANYVPWIRAGDFVFISGQLPMADGAMQYAGHVGDELDVEQGCAAARLCALNGLAQMRAALGSFDALEKVVRVEGHVSSAPGFTAHPQVLNGASDLLKEVLGERAGHARTALGHNELPLGAAVEIAFTVQVRS